MELSQKHENAKLWGRERVQFATMAKTKEDWEKWAKNKNDFAFTWGPCWKQCIEYKVADFEAEVGFFIDVLGCDCNAISSDYAMFTGPQKEFSFGVRKPKAGEQPTPSDAISIEFMIQDMGKTISKLRERGIRMATEPAQHEPGSSLFRASFLTPNGMKVVLWSVEES